MPLNIRLNSGHTLSRCTVELEKTVFSFKLSLLALLIVSRAVQSLPPVAKGSGAFFDLKLSRKRRRFPFPSYSEFDPSARNPRAVNQSPHADSPDGRQMSITPRIFLVAMTNSTSHARSANDTKRGLIKSSSLPTGTQQGHFATMSLLASISKNSACVGAKEKILRSWPSSQSSISKE